MLFKKNYKIVVLIVLCCKISTSFCQTDILMQGWYWDYPKTAAGKNWTDTLSNKVQALANRGFTHIWLPPLSRASFGSNSNGYDPKDLYDLGGYGLGPTGFGTRAQVNNLVNHINASGMHAVADVVYNHRDGGRPELNPAVEGWIKNYTCVKKNAGDNPYPSDRFRLFLPLGGSSGNGAGTYYIKVGSVSGHADFFNKNFRFYCQTNTVGFQSLPDLTEFEPNGGGGCGGNNAVPLGVGIKSWLDNWSSACSSIGCAWEEFAVTINAGQYNTSGDTLWIYLNNIGDYSDHTVRELYYTGKSGNIVNEIKYQTYTNFMNMPSGRATMNYTNFKPNGNPTNLNGDWDAMLFFYDYDQNVVDTRQELIDWTQWLDDSIKISGLRMDAVKHFDPKFLSALFDSLYLTGQTPDLVVGEYFDFDPTKLKNWVNAVENNMVNPAAKLNTEVRVFDFALRGSLKEASDNSAYDVRNLFTSGIVNGASGTKDQSVTFVNNHDFRDAGQSPSYPELLYAYTIINPAIGLPSVYYPDYYGTDLPQGPDKKLKTDIDVLINLRKEHTENATVVDYINRIGTPYAVNYLTGSADKSLVFFTKGGGLQGFETYTVVNFGTTTLEIEVPMAAAHDPSFVQFFEKTGKGLTPSVEVVSNKMKVAIPAKSYGVWSNVDLEATCALDSILYVDLNAIGQNNGSSWKDAYTKLEAAMYMANNCPDVKYIYVKEGSYKPSYFNNRDESFIMTSAYTVKGGFPSAVSNPTFAQANPTSYQTILSGDIGIASATADNSYNVFVNLSNTKHGTIDGIVIIQGNANGTGSKADGGAIFNYGKLIIKDCTFTNNLSTNNSAVFNNAGGDIVMKGSNSMQ